MNLTDKGIKVLIVFVLGTMCLVISGILYFMGYGHSTLAAATPQTVRVAQPAYTPAPLPTVQPASAAAAEFGCTRFHDIGTPPPNYLDDEGICWLHAVKYVVMTFSGNDMLEDQAKWVKWSGIGYKEKGLALLYKAVDQADNYDS